MTTLRVAILLVAAAAAAQAPARRSAIVTKVSAAPRIDGELGEWSPGLFSTSPVVDLGASTSLVEEGAIDSDADHSARLWLTTTPGRLHVAALVSDDQLVATHDAPESYKDDGLEVLFARADGGLFHLGVSAAGKPWVFAPRGASLDGIVARVTKGAPGYRLEVTIPLATFGATDRTLDGWRFNLAARDVDGAAVAHRVWSGFRHSQLASMGTLVVAPQQPAPKALPACPTPKKRVVVDRPLTTNGAALVAGDAGVTLKLVNYQPAATPWDAMWTSFDTKVLAADFQRAAQLGANAIRVFVFYGPFGEHRVKPEFLQRLSTVVDLAASAGLLTVVSFFPFDKEFSRAAWPGMGAHLETIVKALEGHPGVAMWDLMNEPDHRWAQPDSGVTASDVEAWTKEMYRRVKAADPSHLVTAGLAGHFAASDGGVTPAEALPFLDVVSVHGYFDDVPMQTFLSRAASLGKPVVLQEFGRTRLYWSATEVAAFDDAVCAAARVTSIAGVGAWELNDHPVGSIGWSKTPWLESEENWFGLLDVEGRRHPRAASFCRCVDAPAFTIRR